MLDVVVEQLGDVAHAVRDVGNVVFRLHELQRVGDDEPHVDILEQHDVDEVLDRAFAEDRQHPQIFAVVEHVGHVGAHHRHRPADRRGDHRHRARVDDIALRQVGTDDSLLLRHGPASEGSQHDADCYAHHATHTKPPFKHYFVFRMRSKAA